MEGDVTILKMYIVEIGLFCCCDNFCWIFLCLAVPHAHHILSNLIFTFVIPARHSMKFVLLC